MRFNAIVFCLLLLPYPCNALLPPFYQSAKEITSILQSSDIANKITSGRMIQSILRTDNGYRITAGDCTLDVTIIYLASKEGMVGPAEFEIQSDHLICIKK